MADVTVDTFVTRFPQFEGQEDQIAMVLVEAKQEVGSDWEAGDIPVAVMYLTAHLLVSEEDADGPKLKSESMSLGPISNSYTIDSSPGVVTDYDGTEYGRRFMSIRERNCRGPVVI